jgi:hypothetical protein
MYGGRGGTHDGMTGSRSDDCILLALQYRYTTHFQFTVAEAQGFADSTSRL